MTRSDLSRRSWLKATAAAGGVSLLAGCGGGGGGGGPNTPSGEPPEETDAQFVTTEFNTIHNNNYNPYDRLVHPNQSPGYLFDDLFDIAPQGSGENVVGDQGTFKAGLAEDWNRDGNIITVFLRDNYTWHNGDPVTAHNVVDKWTLDKLAEGRKWSTGAFVDCWAEDEYTAKVEVADGANDFVLMDFVSNTLINTHPEVFGQFLPEDGTRGAAAYEEMSAFDRTSLRSNLISYAVRGKYDPESPEGTVLGWGPWKMKRHGETEMIFEVHEDHPDADKINFPEVRFVEYTDNQARYQAMLAERFSGVDLVVTQTVWDQLPDYYARHIYKRRLGVGWAFNYNVFPDYRVRQALAYAMDKEQIVANSGLADELTVPHQYDSAMYDAPDSVERHNQFMGEGFLDKLTVYDQDTEKAAALLEEVGWSRDDGQWYDENDEKVSITIRTPPTWSEWVNMAQTATQHLSDFGIDAAFQTQDLVVYYGQTMIQADYDIAAWWCGGARPTPWFAYNTIWNSLQTIADTHEHPDEYEAVPFPIGDPDGETRPVNWQENLNELARVRFGSDRQKELARELAWTYNQMLPVYCMNENKGLAVINRNEWKAPGPETEAGKVFFPITYMNGRGLINAWGEQA